MRSFRHLLALRAFAFLAAAGAAPLSCGTDAMGIDVCRKIEQARCRKGPACPALGVQAGTGVEECVQFARDRCQHGLATPDPGVVAADQCAAAIDHATCDDVLSPENIPACSFLRTSPVADDAGDGAADTSSNGTADAATDGTADTSSNAIDGAGEAGD